MKTCSQINNTIVFNPQEILPCCVNGDGDIPRYAKLDEIKKGNVDYKVQKAKLVELIDSDKLYLCKCNSCSYIEEKENLPANNKYNLIVLRHWTACNCKCIYCNIKNNQEIGKALYNPAEIIKELYSKDMIDKENLVVHFQGGDIGVLKEFEEIVNVFEENGFERIDFCTNNIIYQPAVQKILSEGKGTLSLSLDCGSDKIYKKIKGVDKFNQYIENLGRYIQNTKNKDLIIVNYIIVHGVNDSRNEIKKFIELMDKTGVKQVGLRLDHNYMNNWVNSPIPIDCPNNLDKIILYFFKLAKKHNIQLDSYKELNLTLLKIFRTNKLKKNNKSLLGKIRKLFTGEL